MDAKPFKTIDQLLDILESRNIFIGDRKEAKRILLTYGYYSLINGYKDPFLNKIKTRELKEDYYRSGTTFSEFYILYLFDEGLRLNTRDALDVAESTLKTACVYAFCSYHQSTQAYLDPSSYITANEYYDRGNYTRNLIKLLSVLQSVRDNKALKKDYIQHYIDNYQSVPLWVIAQTLTFGNMSAFYDLQELKVQNATCRNIEKATEKKEKSIGAKDLRNDFKVLTAFRNICSHGERFYCAKVGNRKQFGFKDLLIALKRVLPIQNVSDYMTRLLEQLDTISDQPAMKRIVTDGLGVNEQILKEILYSK